jgi:hypothetical protein
MYLSGNNAIAVLPSATFIDYPANPGAFDFNLRSLGDFKIDRVLLDFDHLAVDSASRNYLVALLDRLEHFLMLLLLFLLGTHDQEIDYRERGDNHEEKGSIEPAGLALGPTGGATACHRIQSTCAHLLLLEKNNVYVYI